ncbi:MAG: STAS domain-containing protein [Desulfobacteraceae bacterium]
MDIQINIEKHDPCTVVHVSGKIDATTSEELEDTFMDLIGEGETRIILELEKTSYISSAGLRVLVVVTKQLYDSGMFCLCNTNDNVREIIEMAGFTSFMTIYDDLETAKQNITLE